MKSSTQKSKENERRTIRMNKNLVEKIENLAEKDNRNFNNMVETLLLRATEQFSL